MKLHVFTDTNRMLGFTAHLEESKGKCVEAWNVGTVLESVHMHRMRHGCGGRTLRESCWGCVDGVTLEYLECQTYDLVLSSTDGGT